MTKKLLNFLTDIHHIAPSPLLFVLHTPHPHNVLRLDYHITIVSATRSYYRLSFELSLESKSVGAGNRLKKTLSGFSLGLGLSAGSRGVGTCWYPLKHVFFLQLWLRTSPVFNWHECKALSKVAAH